MPKVVDHAAQRERLLDGSFELFATRGYAGVTMRQLARSLGVSTGTLYHYFPDKLAMLGEMFSRMSTHLIATAVEGSEREDLGARRARLARFVAEHEERLRSLIALAMDVHRFEPGEDSRAVLSHTFRAYRVALAAHLELEEGRAGAVLSLLIGTVVQRGLDVGAPGAEAFSAALETLAT
jgi:AcrR family transcriptional regulator